MLIIFRTYPSDQVHQPNLNKKAYLILRIPILGKQVFNFVDWIVVDPLHYIA
jgi:hypothetical protein